MRNMSIRAFSLSAFVAAAFLALPASSFEHRGFRACMSLADAQAVGIKLGLPLTRDHAMPLEDGSMGEFYAVATDPRLNLVFADGKLLRLVEIKKGGYPTFAMTLETLLQQLGQPRIEAGARYSIVMATWSLGGGTHKSLSISKPVDELSVSVLSWIDRNVCK